MKKNVTNRTRSYILTGIFKFCIGLYLFKVKLTERTLNLQFLQLEWVARTDLSILFFHRHEPVIEVLMEVIYVAIQQS